jgi:fibronectin type 3 domain-containing protein
VSAADIPLAWDASTSTNVTNYRVYWGTVSLTYTTTATMGVATTYTVRDLTPANWCFAVTAIDSDGNESDFSNEVCKLIGGKPAAPGNFLIIPPPPISNTNPPPKVVRNP